MNYYDEYNAPYGKIIMVCNDDALIGVYHENQKYYMDHIDAPIKKKHPILNQTKQWLDQYFQGKKPGIENLPIHTNGTVFQEEVWQILKKIPYGTCMSYKEISEMIAIKRGIAKMSAQAVGQAVGHNPISIIIPCHRVISNSGSLTGYAGGIYIKEYLLEFEGYLKKEV